MLEIYQGEDKAFIIKTRQDLTSHTEIKVIVSGVNGCSSVEIIKTLSASQITGVTADQFTVQFDAADTKDVKDGNYIIQVRATDAGGLKTHVKQQPNKFTIKDSAFESQGSGNDYN